MNKSLEEMVRERTRELQNENDRLTRELAERIKTEEVLRASETHFKSIFMNILDICYETTLDGKIVEISPSIELQANYKRNELIGKSLFDIYSNPADREAFIKVLIKEKQISDYEIFLNRKDGSKICVALSTTLVTDESGQPVKIIGSVRDITNRKLAENELKEAKSVAEKANETKTHFLTNVSHEIRTPMNGLLGMTGLMDDSQFTGPQKQYMESINRSAEKMIQVINDILDFSKLDSDSLDFESQKFNLHRLLEELSNELSKKAKKKKLSFKCLINKKVPIIVKSDPGRLKQLLGSLLNNAVKFTEKGGISLEVNLAGWENNVAQVCFTLRDTGIGIPKEKHNDIFEAFTQVDASSTRKHEGLGLGLAISRKICDLLSGKIEFQSKEDQGTTFTVTLPLEAAVEPSEFRPLENSDSLKDAKVLVVDDEYINREVLKAQLKQSGCRIDEASNGDQALEMMRGSLRSKDPYKIVIVDMQMPDMNGETLGRKVREEIQQAEPALVMYTSMGLRGDVARLKKIGFNGYLTKPVDQAVLYDCLKKVTSKESNQGTEETIVTRYTLENMETHNHSGEYIVLEPQFSHNDDSIPDDATLARLSSSFAGLALALENADSAEIRAFMGVIEGETGCGFVTDIISGIDEYDYSEALDALKKLVEKHKIIKSD